MHPIHFLKQYLRTRESHSQKGLAAQVGQRVRAGWRSARRPVRTFAVGLVSALCAVPGPRWQTFLTDRGERQDVELQDGSRITLNTDSLLRVCLTESRRTVVLHRGEALFTVAPDVERPFEVRAGGTIVRARGTAFSVRLRESREVEVLVTQGSVAVIPGGSRMLRSLPSLSAGQMVSIGSERMQIESVEPAETKRRLAWLHGLLSFRGTTLAEAVAEFNRYNRVQLSIADPALEGIRLGGDFQATDVASFVETLKTAFGIRSIPADEKTSDAEVLQLVE